MSTAFNRRGFLQMASGVTLAALSGCKHVRQSANLSSEENERNLPCASQ